MHVVEFVGLVVAVIAAVTWLIGRPHTLESVRRPVPPTGSHAWSSRPGAFDATLRDDTPSAFIPTPPTYDADTPLSSLSACTFDTDARVAPPACESAGDSGDSSAPDSGSDAGSDSGGGSSD